MITLKIEFDDEEERYEFVKNLKDDYYINKQSTVYRTANSDKKYQYFVIEERLKMKPYKPWLYY